MAKLCPHCKLTLEESEFNWKIKNVRLATYCKSCSRKYIRGHYQSNKNYYLDKAKKRNLELKQLEKDYIGEFLKTHPCIDCGETNILVLEFDHKDRYSKDDEIGSLIKRKVSFQRLKREIEKCEVRCANCHRIKTSKENKSWKLKYAPVA